MSYVTRGLLCGHHLAGVLSCNDTVLGRRSFEQEPVSASGSWSPFCVNERSFSALCAQTLPPAVVLCAHRLPPPFMMSAW